MSVTEGEEEMHLYLGVGGKVCRDSRLEQAFQKHTGGHTGEVALELRLCRMNRVRTSRWSRDKAGRSRKTAVWTKQGDAGRV